MSTDSTTDEADDETAAAHRRRTIVRLLVGLGIGIPVLVELATVVGLVEQSLLGSEEPAGNGTDETAGDDGSDAVVTVGDELLPATPQRETLSAASFRASDESWVLTLVASVENTGTNPYTVQFGAVTTEAGRRVEGSGRAVTVAAGETGQVTGTWQLPPGSRPSTVVVTTAVGDAEETSHEVAVGPIPVEGN